MDIDFVPFKPPLCNAHIRHISILVSGDWDQYLAGGERQPEPMFDFSKIPIANVVVEIYSIDRHLGSKSVSLLGPVICS